MEKETGISHPVQFVRENSDMIAQSVRQNGDIVVDSLY